MRAENPKSATVAGPDLSVIVPLFNEEEGLEKLLSALHEALDPIGCSYELVLVDDGSTDGTFEELARVHEHDPTLKVVRFRTNFGQTAAMAAGIEHASGKLLITMDGDLQNDPRDIPALMEKIAEGYDLVAGWRVNRQDKLITRKVPSMIANWLIGKVTGIPIRDNGCSLKAYRAEIIRRVPLYSDMHRFIPAMAATVGARIAQIPVRHHARQFGESKYGLARIYKVLLDLTSIRAIVGYSHKPIGWFAWMCVPALVLAVVFGVMAFVASSVEPTLPLWGSSLVLLVASCFVICLGILSELVKRFADIGLDALVTAQTLRPTLHAPDQESAHER